MRIHQDHRKRRAFISAEIVFAIGLAAVMAVLATNAVSEFLNVTAVDQAQRAVLGAAEGQLQRYQAGAPLDSLPPAGLADESVTLQTSHTPGQEQWSGFQLVTVTAEAPAGGRMVRAQISGYVPGKARP